MLTLRGLECLQKADVILYDGLVGDEILALAPRGVERVCVGKHGPLRSWAQGEIEDAMVRHCRAGKVVVRLKGGDPAVFARTAEELDRLVQEGIPFEVVPGITAALAASSYAGIPITHRDWASAVAFITSHSQAIDGGTEAEESIDWSALARFPGTLVFYMGGATAASWTRKLMEAGKGPSTSAAIVRHCSRADQEIYHTTLQEVGSLLGSETAIRPPVITIVGSVTQLGPMYDWYSKRRLSGRSLLIPRDRAQEDGVTRFLREAGAELWYQPCLEIQEPEDWTALDEALLGLERWDWVLWLSRHGVKGTMERLRELGRDLRVFGNCNLGVIGEGTRRALMDFHLRADLVPESGFDSRGLAEAFLSRGEPEQRVLILRANRGSTELMERLQGAGHRVEVREAYRQVDVLEPSPAVLAAVSEHRVDAMVATSPAVARNLARMFGSVSSQMRWLALSPHIAEVLAECGVVGPIPVAWDGESIAAALEDLN